VRPRCSRARKSESRSFSRLLAILVLAVLKVLIRFLDQLYLQTEFYPRGGERQQKFAIRQATAATIAGDDISIGPQRSSIANLPNEPDEVFFPISLDWPVGDSRRVQGCFLGLAHPMIDEQKGKSPRL
jgi:hypothetical protein